MSVTSTSALTGKGVSKMLDDAQEAWALANLVRHVPTSPMLEMHKEPIQCSVPWNNGSTTLCRTSLDFLPAVVVENMPASCYPAYISPLTSFTIACLRIARPDLSVALCVPNFIRMVTLAVAARAGFWAAVGWTPKPSATLPRRALYFDRKRKELWINKSTGTAEHDLWLAMNALPFAKMSHEEEVARHVSAACPMAVLTGAMSTIHTGPAYATGLTLKAVVRVLRFRMSNDAYVASGLPDRALVECIQYAPLVGAPLAAVRRWALDPLVALGAQRRIATSAPEVEDLRSQMDELLQSNSSMDELASSDDVNPAEFADPLLEVSTNLVAATARVSPAASIRNKEPQCSEAVEVKAEVTPMDSASVIAPDMRFSTDMTHHEADMIREYSRRVQQTVPMAPSALMNADPEASVLW